MSNLFCFLQLKKTLYDFFSSNMVKLDLDLDLDPDPHSEKLLDPVVVFGLKKTDSG